jgi:hypothetical protein
MPFGLPQAGVICPTLYNIFTADIPKHQNCMLALFADDTSFLSTSPFVNSIITNIQNYLASLKLYYKKWKITINNEKSQAIYFTRRRSKEIPTAPLHIFGEQIKWSNEVKYLGFYLDKRLTYRAHINNTIEKVRRVIKIL